MNEVVSPRALSGRVAAIPSKSHVHRLLLCAALSDGPTVIGCPALSADIRATLRCIEALGCAVERSEETLTVTPPMLYPQNPVCDCGESGSTLRFLLPVLCALGTGGTLLRSGRLPQRPLAPLDTQLTLHGARLSPTGEEPLCLRGQLTPGEYALPGGVSSQYITGLLFALPLLPGDSTLTVTGKLESAPYIQMTLRALERFGVAVHKTGKGYAIPGRQKYTSPGRVEAEGDWSNAAFWLCAGALGGPVTVTGLDRSSCQGDRAVLDALSRFGADVSVSEDAVTVKKRALRGIDWDASDTPDLVPALAAVAAAAEGETRFTGASRLRLKESDRIESGCAMLSALGVRTQQTEDGFTVFGSGRIRAGAVQGCGDHRIVMAAAVSALAADGEVTILGAEAADKSYPAFFELLRNWK